MLPYIIPAVVCLLAISEDAHAGVLKQYEDVSTNVTNQISFFLFTNQNKEAAYRLKYGDDDNYSQSPFDSKDPTIFFIHGFGGRAQGTSARTIKNAYLEFGNFNIILVDWQSLAVMPWYGDAIRNSAIVGKYTATMVKWLEAKGALSIPALHVIGFSLGAHVGAFVGEELAKLQTEQIGRITGLDPAGPAFDKFSIQSNGLGQEDAAFVDVIHTNSRFLGLHIAIGHADFYVNYGRAQPGCGTFSIKCSHYRAWEYYAESLKNPCGFPADTCATWKPVVSGCNRDENILMGVGTSKSTRGIFVVETNKRAPFAKVSVNLDDIVLTQLKSAENDHHLYTIAQETELGVANLAHYCSLNDTKVEENVAIELNLLDNSSESGPIYVDDHSLYLTVDGGKD